MLVIILTSTALAGCVDERGLASIDAPRVGDVFHYEGSDGSEIALRVVGESVARDRYLASHDVLLLNFTIRPAKDPSFSFHVEEAVAKQTGLLVRQFTTCAYSAASGTGLSCAEPDFADIQYAPGGLPGGLGVGPLWGEALGAAGRKVLDVGTPLPRIERLETSASALDGGCMEISYKAMPARPVVHGVWLPVTVLHEPFVVCDSLPFPSLWRPTTEFSERLSAQPRPEFRLAGFQRGMGPPLMPGAVTTAAPSEAPVPIVAASDPFLVLDEGTAVVFTSAEAYDAARELDSVFRNATDDGGFLVFNGYLPGGASGFNPLLPLPSEQSWLRRLRVQLDNGSSYEVEVRKTLRSEDGPLADPPTPYAMGPTHWRSLPLIEASVTSRPHLDLAKALEFGQGIFGGDAFVTEYEFDIRNLDLYDPVVYRNDAFKVDLWFSSGSLAEQPGVFQAYVVTIDGPSGTLIRVQLPLEALPDWT